MRVLSVVGTTVVALAGAEGHTWVADLSGRLFRVDGGSATQVTVFDARGKPPLHHVTGCATRGDDSR